MSQSHTAFSCTSNQLSPGAARNPRADRRAAHPWRMSWLSRLAPFAALFFRATRLDGLGVAPTLPRRPERGRLVGAFAAGSMSTDIFPATNIPWTRRLAPC
jgi:hypothetical protein